MHTYNMHVQLYIQNVVQRKLKIKGVLFGDLVILLSVKCLVNSMHTLGNRYITS